MKPLKDTKIGKWIGSNAPELLNTIGDFMPAPIKGAMGVVKNLVRMIPGIPAEKLSEFDNLADEHELEVIRLYNEEMANARNREIEITKSTGSKDKLLMVLAVLGIVMPLAIIGYLIFSNKPVDALVAGFVGIIIGSYTQVFNYYFGSSSGSKSKQVTIDSIMDK